MRSPSNEHNNPIIFRDSDWPYDSVERPRLHDADRRSRHGRDLRGGDRDQLVQQRNRGRGRRLGPERVLRPRQHLDPRSGSLSRTGPLRRVERRHVCALSQRAERPHAGRRERDLFDLPSGPDARHGRGQDRRAGLQCHAPARLLESLWRARRRCVRHRLRVPARRRCRRCLLPDPRMRGGPRSAGRRDGAAVGGVLALCALVRRRIGRSVAPAERVGR